MALYWGFKIWGYQAEEQLRKDASSVTIQLQQGRAFKGEIGDEVVFMQDFEGWTFTHLGMISGLKLLNPEQAFETSYFNYEIYFSEVKPLKEKYTIEDFAYTLTRVYKHYERPYKHFTRKYSRLKKEDFRSIADGKIFLSRTAFGKLLNSLHPQHISIFLQHFSHNNPSLPFRNIDYVDALEQLNEYIEENILSHVDMLLDISNSLTELAPDNVATIGFMNSDEKVDSISQQVTTIKNVLGKEQKYYGKGFSKELLFNVERNMEYEKGLAKHFKDYPIPLTYFKS